MELGVTLFVRDSAHFGEAPPWVPALTVNVEKPHGSLAKGKFAVHAFYPQLVVCKPFLLLNEADEGTTWRWQLPEVDVVK